MGFSLRSDRGFSIIEIVAVLAVLGTLMVVGLPVMKDLTENIKLNEASRMVERELQSARLQAVSVNHVLRVRFNCPTMGYIRTVEVLGNTDDDASDRCLSAQSSRFPFPAPDNDLMTRPNFDGPVRVLPNDAVVSSLTFQFSPDGTAASVAGGTVSAITTPVSFTILRHGKSRTVTINNAGKIQLQQ